MNLVLKPSKIHGVGVFAVKPIRKGKKIPLFEEGDWSWIDKPQGLERRYCTGTKGDGYYRPKNWNRMSIGWYLNHHFPANVDATQFSALRFIRAGEELTIDYRRLSNA